MTQNIIEYLREQAVSQLFDIRTVRNVWPTWKRTINSFIPTKTPHEYLDLGDHLKDIFYSTNTGTGRSQSAVSSGGTAWEALVCWYLNLCLIGRRTVVIKYNIALIPQCVCDATTVNYSTFSSNSESDLIAVTFPDKIEYNCDKNLICINDISSGLPIKTYKTARSKYNLSEILNALTIRDFNDIEVHIIQCKTNWNDNAQIPMLWDTVYAATNFRSGISLGANGYSIADIKRFSYSFATVPTNQLRELKAGSMPVLRVMFLSGGNYWGLPSSTGVANSIKEMLNRNLKSGHTTSHIRTLETNLPALATTFSYFHL